MISCALGEKVKPLVADVTQALHALRAEGANVLFEGAQGAMLDVDHGTYPFVTSSNTTAGFAATGTGLGPRVFDDVLGIVKAYTTRVGARAVSRPSCSMSTASTSRASATSSARSPGGARRCGWFDSVQLRRSVVHSSVSGLCVTKLDVLDGLDTIRVCSGYRIDGKVVAEPPMFVDGYADVRAGVRGAAGLEGIHRRHHRLRAAARSMRANISSACRRW